MSLNSFFNAPKSGLGNYVSDATSMEQLEIQIFQLGLYGHAAPCLRHESPEEAALREWREYMKEIFAEEFSI